MVKTLNKSIFGLALLVAILAVAFMFGEIEAELKFDALYESGYIDQDVYDRYYNDVPENDLELDYDSQPDFTLDTLHLIEV